MSVGTPHRASGGQNARDDQSARGERRARGRQSARDRRRGTDGNSGPEPVAEPSSREVPGRAEPLYGAWGRVSDGFWEGGGSGRAAGALPAQTIRFRVDEVASAANAGDLDGAATLVEQLDRDTTEAYGEAHMYTVQVREVRGYVAALDKDFATALGYYLHAARLRATIQGARHPEVEQASRRAFSLWWAMPPTPVKRQWGDELLAAVTAIHGEDAPVARHTLAGLYSHLLQTAVPAGLTERGATLPALDPGRGDARNRQNEGNTDGEH
ncbi:hypothetical protein AB0912_28710 [Streptomyces sp. NPDC007084]|uniref:hypothetical protein n=1 Tax=Streptomyces sp. NPDC007084 TaxID=3154313 RepID=UPI003452FC8C